MKLSGRAVFRVAAVGLILASAWAFVPRFGTESNLINLLRQAFLLSIIASGVSLSMLAAGLDLSIGSVAALSSCLAASLIVQGHVLLGMLTGLLGGALGGLVNGVMIAKLKLPFFIMTFSMMFIVRGLALTYTQGTSIHGFPQSFTWIGKSFLGPIPMPVILGAGVIGLLHLLLTKTTFGRIAYAVGANAEAARFSGLSVDRTLIQVYSLSGLLAGLSGLIYIARLNAADADLGMLWPLEGIAVAVIGGIAFSGGEGNILGLILGGIVMAVVGNCVNLLGLPARFQDFFIGFVIILVVLIDHLTQKRGKVAS
ncbi:MAG TPA: ABC transporter permease [Candidatus Methylomirabilis sp.]|nr:ABC transporter permease [Candidatus Methylomirabilis sp.]